MISADRSRNRSGHFNRFASTFALGAFAFAATLLSVLHLSSHWGGINPFTTMLSDYALTPGWWIWDLMLVMTSLGSVILLWGMMRHEILAGRVTLSCMTIWCLSVLFVAIFTKDPQGGAVSPTGKIHLYATVLSCASLPLVGVVLGRRHGTHAEWHRFAVWARRLAWCSVPFFVPFILPFAASVLMGSARFPKLPTGLFERLMALLDLCLLIVLGLWLRHVTSGKRLAADEAAEDKVLLAPQVVD
jgi:hypothetical protein